MYPKTIRLPRRVFSLLKDLHALIKFAGLWPHACLNYAHAMPMKHAKLEPQTYAHLQKKTYFEKSLAGALRGC